MLAPLENPAHQFADFRINQRFSTADADDRSASFIDGLQALGDGQLVLDGLRILADTTAAGASQITGVQGFEHQYQRETRLASQLLAGHVTDHARRQTQRETHRETSHSYRG